MNSHITPGANGWTPDAGRIARAISAKKSPAQIAEEKRQTTERREIAEAEYYEENHCAPRPMGYFGTETNAHFYER